MLIEGGLGADGVGGYLHSVTHIYSMVYDLVTLRQLG